ncbi:hypothetical protein J2Y46_001082 [Microbacterium sp. BE35]|nr:hypothetical protein [Microbacterium sp. BE35]MDR7188266.1 hypothetical protein [Microbacterium sp. BE35]
MNTARSLAKPGCHADEVSQDIEGEPSMTVEHAPLTDTIFVLGYD